MKIYSRYLIFYMLYFFRKCNNMCAKYNIVVFFFYLIIPIVSITLFFNLLHSYYNAFLRLLQFFYRN